MSSGFITLVKVQVHIEVFLTVDPFLMVFHQQEIILEELWFDEYHAQLLREMYDQMVLVWYEIESVNDDTSGSEDDASESEVDLQGPQERLIVYIDHKSVREVAGVFGLDVEQVCLIEQLQNH